MAFPWHRGTRAGGGGTVPRRPRVEPIGRAAGTTRVPGTAVAVFAEVLGPTSRLLLGHVALGNSPGSLSLSFLIRKGG